MSDDDWVSSWAWGDFDFDLRVYNGELLERIAKERAVNVSNRIEQMRDGQAYFIPLELPAQSQ
jgi:hypothetical protein